MCMYIMLLGRYYIYGKKRKCRYFFIFVMFWVIENFVNIYEIFYKWEFYF